MTPHRRQALIGLGANLGERARTLEAALARLRAHPAISLVTASPLYETEPVGPVAQPAFLNLAAGLESTLTPEGLLELLLAIEAEFGRVRAERWGPRTLDLDLLAFEDETRATGALELPHPRLLERAFVMVPLRDVLAHPRFDRPCWRDLRAKLGRLPASVAGVRPFGTAGSSDGGYATATAFLLELKGRGVRPGLERMQHLVAALGHPERATPCIHIAGTNGKGSVAAMLEAILRTAGWRTGLYTSPHLIRLGERIQVNRQSIDEASLTRLVHELRPVAMELGRGGGEEAWPSYFEFMTALAFRHFQDTRCDIAVIETGMGGRLDATNVVRPEVSVISSIGLDHMEFLGDTLEKIAAEKAGIIKPGRPVVIGRLPRNAEDVVRAVAKANGAPVHSIRDDAGEAGAGPATRLAGDHQRVNAATAALTVRQLAPRWRVSDDIIAAGLGAVEWPGRWQRVAVGDRTVILDAAHNAEGAGALETSLAQLAHETGRAPILVVGALGRPRAAALLDVAARHAAELHLVVPRQARACTHPELEGLVPPSFRGRIVRSTVEAIFPTSGSCVLGHSGDTIVVTGSIYLLGEVLVRLDPSRGPLEGHLQDF